MVKEGDTIVIAKDFPNDGLTKGDEKVVVEVDEEGTAWIDLDKYDLLGLYPDEYSILGQNTSIDIDDIDKSLQNQRDENLRRVFG